ncbi:complement receptor type 2-like [Branchiostoma floridae x Branchiostoma japonicum]
MLVVLTDGNSGDVVNAPAQLLRGMGVTIFAVGVGMEADISQATLQAIAGDPNRVFRLTSHNLLPDDSRAATIRQSVCNAIRCPALTAPSNGNLNPAGVASPGNVVTVTCNQGYNPTGQTSLTCLLNGDWSANVPTCNRVQCPPLTAPTNGGLTPTGMNSYQDAVTFSCNTGYGLSGATTLRCQANGAWSDPIPTCQPGQCPTLTAPTNGMLTPTGMTSYQDTVTFSCNAGYVLNGASTTTCQINLAWSDAVPTCQRVQCPSLGTLTNGVLRPSGATSYQDVVEFICNLGYQLVGPPNTTCQADRSWSNPVQTCRAVQCPSQVAPANGAVSSTGPNVYQDQVTFSCNPGYGLDGTAGLTCQADGMWSNPAPTCRLGQCPSLAAPTNGQRDNVGVNSFQTTVTFTCNSGYQLVGASSATCQAGLTWSDTVPTCQPVSCPARTAPANGAVNPTGAASYQDEVQFTCDQGYQLNGNSSATCEADGTWSASVPTCTVVQCPTLTPPTNGALTPTGTTSYNTVVTFSCNTGYVRNGAETTTCQADGTWSNAVPTCTPVTCPTLTAPVNGVWNPTGANSYTNTVTINCNAGYVPDGVSSITCQADRSWSAALPTCRPVQCPPLTAPVNGALSQTGATSFSDVVQFLCNTGYELDGATSATCEADQTWSATTPTCRVVQCPVLSDPLNGAVSPAGANSYNNVVNFNCDTGYRLSGVSTLTCRADGSWNNAIPACTVVTCPTLTTPTNGALNPTGANSYPVVVSVTCNTGYERNGASSVTCQADGAWSAAVATCTPVQCPALVAPTNGAVDPTGSTSYQDIVRFTCDTGYQLNGASSTTCQSDQTWSATVPTCTVVQCPLLSAPVNGALTPAGLTSYQDRVTFSCIPGYVLSAAAVVTCQANGAWSHVPTCSPVQCPILSAPDNGSLSTGATSYQIVVTFTCNLGYERVGAASSTCQSDRTWSDPVATCIPVRCPQLTSLANGVINPPNRNTYQDVVTFTCNQGFELNGENAATCRADRTWSEAIPSCTDINECTRNRCHSLATCTNTIGSFQCTCFSGYAGDGFTCADINECAAVPGPCHQFADCTNLPGSFTCNCTEGYIGNGFTCTALPCDRLDLQGWDIVFLLDSADLGNERQTFEEVKSFTRQTIDELIDSDGVTRIGLVQYDDTQNTTFNLNQHQTKAAILNAVDSIEYLGGGTYTGRAIHYARQISFSTDIDNGNRDNRPDAMIVVTDGVSIDPITYASTASRHQGITVFAVGIGDRIDRATLQQIAENDGKVFQVTDQASRTQAIRSLKGWFCRGVYCGDPPAPASGTRQGTLYEGGRVDYSCSDGHTLVGTSSITCQRTGTTGTWSNTNTPICIVGDPCSPNLCENGGQCFPTVTSFRCRCASGYLGNTCGRQLQCPALPNPINGALSPTGVTANQTVVTFSCNTGYVLIGAATTTCQADERWSNPVPTCTRRQCPALTATANGVRTPATGANFYTNTITFTCDTGYQLNGDSILTCQADGTWSSAVPTCTSSGTGSGIQCPTLTAPTNGGLNPSAGPYVSQQEVTFTCNTGYQLSGTSTSRCRADGTWSSAVPTCTTTGSGIQCPALTAPTNGFVNQASGPYNFGDIVMFNCNSGYQISSISIRRCQSDGTWSDPVPTCTATGTSNTAGLSEGDIAAIAGGSALAGVVLLALLAAVCCGAGAAAGNKNKDRP